MLIIVQWCINFEVMFNSRKLGLKFLRILSKKKNKTRTFVGEFYEIIISNNYIINLFQMLLFCEFI